jgi:hypothetical protein
VNENIKQSCDEAKDVGPPKRKSAPTTEPDPRNNTNAKHFSVASRQVSWWLVHEHVQPLLELVGDWPAAGTPAWCELPEGPVKLAALYDAARHWALRLELNQAAMAEASHGISADGVIPAGSLAYNTTGPYKPLGWADVQRQIGRRRDALDDGAYIPREVA